MATGLLELLKLKPLPVEKAAQPSATTVATSPDATVASRPPLADDERTRANAKRLTAILAKGYDEKIARVRAAIDAQPMPAVKAKLAAEIAAFSAARTEVDELAPIDGARRMKKLDSDALALAVRAEGLLNAPVGAQATGVRGAPPNLSASAAGPGGEGGGDGSGSGNAGGGDGKGGGGDKGGGGGKLTDEKAIEKIKEWTKQGKISGDTKGLREQLGNKKDKVAQRAAREEVEQIRQRVEKGEKVEVKSRAVSQNRGTGGGSRDRGDPDDARGTDEDISTAAKKRLEGLLRNEGLSKQEIKDFGEWKEKNNKAGETGKEKDPNSKEKLPDSHDHLDTPEQVRAAVKQWREEEGRRSKGPGRQRESRGKKKGGGGGDGHGGDDGSGHGGGETEGGEGTGNHDGGGTGSKHGGGKADADATHGKAGTGDDHGGDKTGGGATKGKGGTGDEHGGGKGGGDATKRKVGAVDEHGGGKGDGGATHGKAGNGGKQDGKGTGAKRDGGTSKGTPGADGPASKIPQAAFNAAHRKLNGLMSAAQAKINELAKTNPDARELADAIDKTNTVMDVKSFMDDPKGFVAQKSKQALIDMPFNHFSAGLEKSSAEFQARFPSISDLNQAPLTNGTTLIEYERRYNKATAQLRVPKARKVLLQTFVLLGVNEHTPDKEIQRRLQAADQMLAAMPDLSTYVKAYYVARDEYGFNLVSSSNKLDDLNKKYEAEVPRLAAGLRERAALLGRIAASLKEVADQIMDSPFIYFAPGETAWFDFDHLAGRFSELGSRMSIYADLVDQRKADYPGELKRIDAENTKLGRNLMDMI